MGNYVLFVLCWLGLLSITVFILAINGSAFAFIYNTIGIPIAAMAFSSVSVVLNALRLQKVKLNK